MEMYHFVTNWFFSAPKERVWEETANMESYPSWWKDLRKAEIRGPESRMQLGSVIDCEVRGALPYSLRFTVEVTTYEPPDLMVIKSSGDLVGEGRWILESRDDWTASTFYWDVGTTNRVLNLLGKLPFLRKMLEKNHDDVMAKGYEIVKARIEG
ncbi:MAG: SRPBCC family protein [Dehalococcoidia bacterium]|nr:MAG: SRPBCC family protein [Dehalococcoidia bacterium]